MVVKNEEGISYVFAYQPDKKFEKIINEHESRIEILEETIKEQDSHIEELEEHKSRIEILEEQIKVNNKVIEELQKKLEELSIKVKNNGKSKKFFLF